MNRKISLPKPQKKKKIDLNAFVKLANKVKKIFEEEKKYLEEHKEKDEDRTSRRFIVTA